MVLVLDEIAVVMDPFVIAVSVVATRTVVAHVVFATETLSVMPYAAVLLHPSAHQTLSENVPFVANTCHCFPPVPSPDDENLNRNVHF